MSQIEINLYKEVKISNPFIVRFLSENKNNPGLLQAWESAIENLTKCVMEFMMTYSKDQDARCKEDSIMEFLMAWEERQRGIYAMTAANVEGVIAKKLEAYNVENVVGMLNSTMNESVKSIFTNSQRDIELSLMNFEHNMRDELRRCTDNFTKRYDDMSSEIERLPDVIMSETGMATTNDNIKALDSRTQFLKNKLGELELVLSNTYHGTIQKLKDNRELSQVQQALLINKLQTIPTIINGLTCEAIKGLENRHEQIQCKIIEGREQMKHVQTSLCAIQSRLENIDKQIMVTNVKSASDISTKGAEGERRIFDLLSSRLMLRDGFTVEICKGQACQCDLVIRRQGYNPVRIEIKTFTDKVTTKEVEKFHRDLLQLDNNGIFVSVKSGIVGIGNNEIQQLPNGKFAVYLSNNNYDVDTIITMIHLLYRLDDIVLGNGTHNKKYLSTETLMRVRDHIKEYMNKINTIKNHMKESMSLLNEIQMSVIEKLINQADNSALSDYCCDKCGKVCSSAPGLISHKKKCYGE